MFSGSGLQKGIEHLSTVCPPGQKSVAFTMGIFWLPDCVNHQGLWAFPHTSGPLNPTLPSPVSYRPPCSPSQVKFQGQSHGGLSGGQQGEDGEVTAVTGLWWCTRPCWRGDAGPILRPEVHHHNLEDHWAPGRNWKNKGEGAPEQEEDKEAA